MSGLIVAKKRLIRLGPNSIAITLPPEWVKRWGLEPGQEVAVVGNGILQIVPPSHVTLLSDTLMSMASEDTEKND